MPAPARIALLFLLLAFAGVFAPLVAGEDCDEPCGPHCGDCVWCPLVADLAMVAHSVDLFSAALTGGADRFAFLGPARVLDHIPLRS
jgi:hypothetical protein